MTTRDRIVITVIVCAGLIAAFWFFALSPKRAQGTRLTSQIATQQQALDAANQTIAASAGAQRLYGAAFVTLARLGKAVPSDKQVPSLIYQISGAAGAHRVAFKSLAASTSTSSTAPSSAPAPGASGAAAIAGLQPLPFTFTFSGNFFHLDGFFRAINNFVVSNQQTIVANGRLLAVDNVTLAAGAGGFPSIVATVQATAFVLPLHTPPTVPSTTTNVSLPGLPGGKLPIGGGTANGQLPNLPTASAGAATP
jgi:hypothetical protein